MLSLFRRSVEFSVDKTQQGRDGGAQPKWGRQALKLLYNRRKNPILGENAAHMLMKRQHQQHRAPRMLVTVLQTDFRSHSGARTHHTSLQCWCFLGHTESTRGTSAFRASLHWLGCDPVVLWVLGMGKALGSVPAPKIRRWIHK
jgi:hypothetical protein